MVYDNDLVSVLFIIYVFSVKYFVYTEGDDEFRKVNGADSIKLRVKEKVQSRQNLTGWYYSFCFLFVNKN